jgi:ABC-type Zn uptake system ZnuABC Zn-binding protein ZnuA
MRARWIVAVTLVGALGGLLLNGPGCSRAPDPWDGTKKVKVLTTIVPLHCFAANIAEPDAEVRCLLTERGPHGAEPSPHEAKMLSTADLFVANGLKLENFIDRMVRSVGNPKLKVLRAGEHIPDAMRIKTGRFRHGDHWHEGGSDPHVWLGIEEAKIQIVAIRDALIEIDPAHQEGYQQRTQEYLAKLDALKTQGAALKDTPGGLVTFHDSFRYFCRSFFGPQYQYRLVGAIRGIEGEDISSKELQEQVEIFRQKGIRAIGIEPQYPDQAAKNIARALGGDVRIITLDPLETGPPAEGRSFYVEKDWYVKRMERNIEELLRGFRR